MVGVGAGAVGVTGAGCVGDGWGGTREDEDGEGTDVEGVRRGAPGGADVTRWSVWGWGVLDAARTGPSSSPSARSFPAKIRRWRETFGWPG